MHQKINPWSLKRQCGLQTKPKMACIQHTRVHRDSESLPIRATNPNPKWTSSVWRMSDTNLLTKGGEVLRTRDRGRFLLTSPSFVRRLFILQLLSSLTTYPPPRESQALHTLGGVGMLSVLITLQLSARWVCIISACTHIMRVND